MDHEPAPSGTGEAAPSAEAELAAAFPRNALVTVSWEVIWGIGTPCCLISTVVPAYLLALGASKTLVQTVLVGFSLFAGLQLLSTRVIYGPRRVFRIFVVWGLFCAGWLAYGILASLGWEVLPRGLWIPAFILVCAGLAVAMHLGSPTYGELIVENIPLRKRGRLGAMRIVGLGVSGLVGVWLADWLMHRWPEPHNFHYSLVIGSSIMLVSCLIVLGVRDVAVTSGADEPIAAPALQVARELIHNFNFRVFLVFYMLLVAAQSLTPLLIGYGKDVLALPMSGIAWFSGAYFFGIVIVGVLVSPLADRFGFRLIAISSAAFGAAAFLLPLCAAESRSALLVSYAFVSGSMILNGMVIANLGAELVPEVKPAMIIAVGGTITMPFSLGMAPLGGWLVDAHGQAGYLAVLVMGLTASVCALVGFITVVREPRTGQEIILRFRRV